MARLRRGQHSSSGSDAGTATGSVIYRPALLLSLQLLLLAARPAEPFLSSHQAHTSSGRDHNNHHGHLATTNNADETDTGMPPTKPVDTAHAYAVHWEDLLTLEHREIATELRARRGKWSNDRLETTGMAVLDAIAEPETEMYGEKVVRVTKEGETRMRDRFSTGDILVLTATYRERFVPREVCVVDVVKDGMTLSVGPTWPAGLWEERRRPGSYIVRLDRTAPQATLLAQRKSLQMVRKGEAGSVASFLADSFFNSDRKSREMASELPPRFANGAYVGGIVEPDVNVAIGNALDAAKNATSRFRPNPSQHEAISWALSRRISLIRGPPGTGKTRVASLLIATALRLRGAPNTDSNELGPPPKVLAVAHSNGAADVLLEALLAVGVPAIRAGRPATVSPNARKRTVVAMTQTHPEVVALGKQARNASLPESIRSHAAAEAKRVADEVRYTIAQAAPVVVASCIGAHQLLKDGMGIGLRFPLVVLDEASQTTEPALICALAAAKAEQIVMVGDTKQLPPTIASGTTDLRSTLGVSPMARLETGGVDERTLKTQYRMPPSLLDFPSKYFYGGEVKCAPGAKDRDGSKLPTRFPWPGNNDKKIPLAFVHLGGDLETTHDFGGRSNTPEAELVCRIVMDMLSTVEAHNIAVISPYSRQVDKIRGELSGRNIRNVRVGTVDSFQGQEKDIVIISATRSNDVGDVGFLRDPRRLNVALTRTKRGLVIIGDQKTLRNSRHWAALLDSCLQRGCMMDATVLRRRESDHDEQDITIDSDGEDDLLSSLFSTEDALANLLK